MARKRCVFCGNVEKTYAWIGGLYYAVHADNANEICRGSRMDTKEAEEIKHKEDVIHAPTIKELE